MDNERLTLALNDLVPASDIYLFMIGNLTFETVMEIYKLLKKDIEGDK